MTSPESNAMEEENLDLAQALDQTLTDLINLGLVAKQAHWNVVGASFHALHTLLDDLADAAREEGDRVAERSITLGRHPDGRADTVLAANPLPTLEAGPIDSTEVIAAFRQILEIVTTRLFAAINAAECDPVTQDVFIGAAGRLEKLAWMMRAHRA